MSTIANVLAVPSPTPGPAQLNFYLAHASAVHNSSILAGHNFSLTIETIQADGNSHVAFQSDFAHPASKHRTKRILMTKVDWKVTLVFAPPSNAAPTPNASDVWGSPAPPDFSCLLDATSTVVNDLLSNLAWDHATLKIPCQATMPQIPLALERMAHSCTQLNPFFSLSQKKKRTVSPKETTALLIS